MNNKQKDTLIKYLRETHIELRGELRDRIKQRDNLIIQYISIIGVLLGVQVTQHPYALFSILLIPLVTLYFAIQIFSSYVVHDRLVLFIRENIEKKLCYQLGISDDEFSDYFWEAYCEYDRKLHNVKLPGSRKTFFIVLVKVMPFVCSIIFYLISRGSNVLPPYMFIIISIASLIISLALGFYYIYRFDVKPIKIENDKLAKRDYICFNHKKKNTKKAVFFDRDGTLHKDLVETTLDKGLELFDDSISTIESLHNEDYLIIIVSNQSGIAKKNITVKQMHQFNKALRNKLRYVDAIYYCPHVDEDNCQCKKPKPGMFERARREFDIDMSKSYMIGDKPYDLEAAKNAGIPSNNLYLVSTGIKDPEYKPKKGNKPIKGSHIIKSLSESLDTIINHK